MYRSSNVNTLRSDSPEQFVAPVLQISVEAVVMLDGRTPALSIAY